MKKKVFLALALSAATFTAAAAESELGYTNVELGYAQSKADTSFSFDGVSAQDTRPKGYYVKGSFELGQTPFYVFGGYAQGKARITEHVGNVRHRSNVRDTEFNTGLGYYYAINPRLNLLAETSYAHARETIRDDGLNVRINSNSLRFAFGVDAMMTDSLEGWAKLNYTKRGPYKVSASVSAGGISASDHDVLPGDTSGAFGTSLGMQYKFNSVWGITGQADFERHNSGFGVGVRASF